MLALRTDIMKNEIPFEEWGGSSRVVGGVALALRQKRWATSLGHFESEMPEEPGERRVL
jgi:hypothetical protein